MATSIEIGANYRLRKGGEPVSVERRTAIYTAASRRATAAYEVRSLITGRMMVVAEDVLENEMDRKIAAAA